MIGDLDAADATELAGWVAKGDVSPTELLDAALAAVEERNPAVNAVVLIREGVARKAIADGLPPGPFRGVPFLIKDLGIEAKDFPSHNGSRLLANTIYPGDSAIFTRIKATGVVTFGRTTSPEGGIGAATEAAVAAEDQDPVVLGHHGDPAGAEGHGLGGRAFGQGEAFGKDRGRCLEGVRHPGDKEADHGYDTADHREGEQDHQPFQDSQAGRERRIGGVGGVGHG